jgi:hypothetical protein
MQLACAITVHFFSELHYLKPFAHDTVHDLPVWRAPRLAHPVAWMPVPKAGSAHRVLVHCVEAKTAGHAMWGHLFDGC